MRTLRESLLDDIETTMKNGDKILKNYKVAEKELENLYNKCKDLKNYAGGEFTDYIDRETTKTGYNYQLFVECPKLLKFFGINAKNIFLVLLFSPNESIWRIRMHFISTKPIEHFSHEGWLMLNGRTKNEICFEYKDTSFYPYSNSSNTSKYTCDDMIEKYILPKFSSMDAFKTDVVEPCNKKIPDKVITI